MLFKTDEVLLLENLTYLEDIAPFHGILKQENQTIAELISAIDFDAIDDEFDYATMMNGFDWKNLLTAIQRNPKLMETYIQETHIDEAYKGGGGVSVLFIHQASKEAVVAYRGTATHEWDDDFVGANKTDSFQQVNALEWYKKIYIQYHLEDYYVTLTGHSKGGNKAKYITIIEDTPNRCVSFDGQGFSDVFMEFYKDRILLRKDFIENHNVDFDYVNILLNDIGKKLYYIGYDYGKGGFAEAHCPNTFFNFTEMGVYTMNVNPKGQRPEMQILDQYINSMARSGFNEKEKNETNHLLGMLIEKAFSIDPSKEGMQQELADYICNLVGDETYIDNAAYLIAFTLLFTKNTPDFLTALKDILVHFKMEDFINVIDMFDDFVNSKKLYNLLNLSNFLVQHANNLVARKVQSIAKKNYNIDLTKEQIKSVLVIVSLVKEMMKTIKIENGADIDFDEDMAIENVSLPKNLDIAVICGGLSNERNLSLATGLKISEALKEKGHNVILLDAFMGYKHKEIEIEDPFADVDTYSLKLTEISNEIPDLWAVKKRRQDNSNSYFGPNVLQICKQADLVYIALLGANSENGKVQATFDLLGIEYTGCDHFSSACSSNKNVAKQVLTNAGIAVPKGYFLRKKDEFISPKSKKISYPVVVKPNNGGIGLGVSIATDEVSYKKALKEAFRWESEVIVEEYIVGREFSVGILQNDALPVIEVLPLNTRDANVGLTLAGKKVTKCPAAISKTLANNLTKTALAAKEALQLDIYSSVDFIVRENGEFVCLECNSLPPIGPDSLFALEAQAAGISYADLCEKIMTISLKRK